MKTSSIVCLALAGFLVVFNHLSNYWLGYSESKMAFAATDPILGLLVEIGLFACLFCLVMFSLSRKPRSWLPLGSLFAFWPIVILTFVLTKTCFGLPGSLIAHGLRDRVMHDYTLEDLRHFARDVSQGISFKSSTGFGKWINHGDTSELTETEKRLYAQLKEKYSFLHWMDNEKGSGGPSILNQGDDGIVNFEWGGPLGHWGCSVSINGAKNEPVPDPDTTIFRVSDDIYFYSGD